MLLFDLCLSHGLDLDTQMRLLYIFIDIINLLRFLKLDLHVTELKSNLLYNLLNKYILRLIYIFDNIFRILHVYSDFYIVYKYNYYIIIFFSIDTS